MDSSSSSQHWRYDAFLSFRGEDTRKSFTAHLYKELCTKGINTFIDDDKLRRGEVISPALLTAIESSMFSIIVLSENYASSSWCLEELVKILECMKTRGQRVVPIFYNVDPSDVRKQRGNFGKALAEHEENLKENKKRVQIWKDALVEVANLSGWDSRNKYEPMLIQEIVTDILNRLFHISSCDAKNLVGINSSLQEMELLLCLESREVRMVGIWGMAGIGKTTLAKAIYQHISGHFEACSFLENVGDDLEKRGFLGLEEKFLSQLLEDRNLNIQGLSSIKARLHFKKVLIVIDDVNSSKVLEVLVGNHDWFGQGSRIIVTTRNKHLLVMHGVDEVYEIRKLNNDNALELFSHYAFKQVHPQEDYVELSKRVIVYAQGLPLALKVLGSFLFSKSKHEWESELAKLRRIPNMEIQDVLQVSFYGLDDKERDIFLDIACFFKGEDKDYVMKILNGCGFFPDIGIRVLIEKSLITILDNRLMMHDLLQEMGREIVRQTSLKEPGKRSRLWFHEDVHHVLTKRTATEEVEAMFLDLSNLEEILFTTEAFARMNRLRLLKVYKSQDPRDEVCTSQKEECKVQFSRDFKFHYDDLRYLYWHGYPFRSLSSDFNPKGLVDLSMPYSHIKQLWKGVKVLDKLKFMELSSSKLLTETPDFSGITNLERLVFEDCTHLHKIHPSLGGLSKLVFLSLRNCINLRHFPSSGKLESLQILILSGCSKLEKFPEIRGYMEHLSELYLGGTAIMELPSSIEYASGLVLLDLKNCKKFRSFPTCIHNLKSLETLIFSGSLESEDVQENFGNLEWFKKLYSNGTAIRGMPSSISLFRNLGVLSFGGCSGPPALSWSLPRRSSHSIDFLLLSDLCSLQHLDLSHCNLSEEADLSKLGLLSSLKKLNLSGNNFVSLPSNVLSRLSQLTRLDLHNCRSLQALLELPSSIQSIDAHNCTSLEIIPNQSIFKSLYHASFMNCFQLMEYQSSLETLFLTVAMDATETDFHVSLFSSIVYHFHLSAVT
ncbi:hypothetical protein PVL29_024908 [Vitis rotundifolia]|uniref:ADP-ribosyl cyclase/cyclic ADP-ribose hydrolase n=1 Tax=Vitis rotundifolia TaxID=103349 RepID=A0AA39DAD2_VITRO|nr:hypothetical protein PVL29_024908 [Vitis rotundifolia]